MSAESNSRLQHRGVYLILSFISSDSEAEALLWLETQLGRTILPVGPPWGSPILFFPCSALGVSPLWFPVLCNPVPCCRCNVAVNQLQLKAHQQICLFSHHTSPCLCQPHSGSPNPCVYFPTCVPSLPGREEETSPSPNPAWTVLLLSSNPPRLFLKAGAHI